MNDWKNKGERDIKTVREVARQPGKDNCTKGRISQRQQLGVVSVPVMSLRINRIPQTFLFLVNLFCTFSMYLYLNHSQSFSVNFRVWQTPQGTDKCVLSAGMDERMGK